MKRILATANIQERRIENRKASTCSIDADDHTSELLLSILPTFQGIQASHVHLVRYFCFLVIFIILTSLCYKILRCQMWCKQRSTSSIRKTFLGQIRVLGKLRHPNIVTIIGAGIQNTNVRWYLGFPASSLNVKRTKCIFNFVFSVTERGSEMLIMELMVISQFSIYPMILQTSTWAEQTLDGFDFWSLQENGSLYSLIHNGTIPIETGLAAQLLLDVAHGNELVWSTGLECKFFFQFLTSLTSGIRYLHSLSPPICHADLRSSNILWGIVAFINNRSS